jgi:hypothetical protein
MRIVDVTIEGIRAILLHNPAAMGGEPSNGKRKTQTPKDEAAAGCYWTENGDSLAFPGLNIYRAMVQAAGGFKAGRLSMTSYIAGGIEVRPEMISFGTKAFEIDTRRAVIQRQGFLRSRAKIPTGWRLKFQLLISEEDLPQKSSLDMLREILEEAGRRIGIGDFRPQKTGPFGKFKIVEWGVR